MKEEKKLSNCFKPADPPAKLQESRSILFYVDFTCEEIILLELWWWVVWKYILLTTPTDIKRIT